MNLFTSFAFFKFVVLHSGLKVALISVTVVNYESDRYLNFINLQHAIGLNRNIAPFSKIKKYCLSYWIIKMHFICHQLFPFNS